ncbi:hypothetical protein K505DRAFT_323609 [Melanomma pulvis-pyrius CBS 109.77]|uniref:Uncharacterized protein n=1 Tax=Melanomma pulvis-pyrius CBS 109.77 TaxID=1314802 RepID=A0A6A6XIR8_9PLEO|nr:hypothetical protein K505DRAFT_323609 [Melanomma pulvis-pyrius CBS 109.77]
MPNADKPRDDPNGTYSSSPALEMDLNLDFSLPPFLIPISSPSPSPNPNPVFLVPSPAPAPTSPAPLPKSTPSPAPSSPSPSPSIDLDLDYLHDDPYHSASNPRARGEDLDDLDLDALDFGDVVRDREGGEWMWMRCFCGHVLCRGKAVRKVSGRRELSVWDRGRLEEEEEEEMMG